MTPPTSANSNAYPAIGSVVAGKYRLEEMLGEGGMGAVFRATEVAGANAGRPVALKFVSSEVRNRPGIMSRFANEATAAAKIASEHVVKTFGVEALQDGTPFIVMELLQGRDLDAVIEKESPLPPERAVHFTLQILRALQVAHGVGVVHRDMKPANVFVVTQDGDNEFVKIIDFGITKILGEDGGLTKTSTTLGTPAYMAPEQAKSAKAADARSDLYAVGVILYELLTKKRPFDGDSHNELVVKICTEPPVPIRTWRNDLPSKLVAAVEKALVKSPTGRHQTARDFADALQPFAAPKSGPVLARIAGGMQQSPNAQSLPASLHSAPQAPPSVAMPETAVRVGVSASPVHGSADTPIAAPAQRIGGTTAPMNASDLSTAQTAPAGQMGAAIAAAHSALAQQQQLPAAPQPQASPLAMTGPAPQQEARQPEKTVLGDVGPMDFGKGGTQEGMAAANPYSDAPYGAAVAPVAPVTPAAFAPSPASSEYDDGSGGGGRGVLFVLLGVVALGLVGSGVYLAVGSGSSTPPRPAATQTAATKSKPTVDQGDDDDDDSSSASKKKKKKPEKPGIEDDESEPPPPIVATAPPPTTTSKPKPTTTTTSTKPAPTGTTTTTTPTTTTSSNPFPFPFPFPSTTTSPKPTTSPTPTTAPTTTPTAPPSVVILPTSNPTTTPAPTSAPTSNAPPTGPTIVLPGGKTGPKIGGK